MAGRGLPHTTGLAAWQRVLARWSSRGVVVRRTTLQGGCALRAQQAPRAWILQGLMLPPNTAAVCCRASCCQRVHPGLMRSEVSPCALRGKAKTKPPLCNVRAALHHPARRPATRSYCPDFHEYSLLYGLPAVSLKGCCYHLLAAGAPGFQVRWGQGWWCHSGNTTRITGAMPLPAAYEQPDGRRRPPADV